MNKLKFALLVFAGIFLALAVISNAMAIGITPGRVTLDFTPGLQKTIEIKVINNEHKDMRVMFGVMGELADYITLNTKSVDFKADEESKTFSYTFTLPIALTPGQHETKIAAAELPPEGTGEGVYIGSTVVVTSQLLIKSPYPYKYAEVRLNVKESPINGTTNFYVEVENLGQQDLVDMQAVIEIMGATNEKIAIVKTDTQTVPAGKKLALTASWKAEVYAGQYKALASLVYDEGKIANAESIFGVGSLELDVVDISVRNFKLGDIAKFDITVENKWNEEIKDVYAQLKISDQQNQEIANVKTPSLNVPPLGRQVLNAYWDTAGVREGTYSGKLLLNYANKVLEKQLKTEINLNSIKVEIIGAGITAKATAAEGGKQNLAFILIIVLIIINVAWFIYFKMKDKKKR